MQENETRQVSPITTYPIGAAYPAGAPVYVTPVQTIVHPTRYFEQHTVARHPIVHVYPTHFHRIHHDIYEHYCEYPCSQSQECCQETINCCPSPMTAGEA